ncbi:MAG TPA: hypothetical protein VMR52_11195 [Dehalococcoidia bacterium]|nr:hypothetical protein [Dehalococcoidia bacterium]
MQITHKRPTKGTRAITKLRESVGWVLGSALVLYIWLAAALGLIVG